MIQDKSIYWKEESGIYTDVHKIKIKYGKVKDTYNDRGTSRCTHLVFWKFKVAQKWLNKCFDN